MAKTPNYKKIKRIRRANIIGQGGTENLEELFDPQTRWHSRLLAQVNAEYDLCWRYMRPRIQENFTRLSLYNNQMRDKDRTGDPFMFTVHQTVLANLLSDTMKAQMGGRSEKDETIAEHLESVYEMDCEADGEAMMKPQLDFEWNWDALAFGSGLCWFNEYDFEANVPVPTIWDPLTFIRDPRAVSPNGNRLGENAMRFGGREIRKTLWEMRENPEYFNLEYLKKSGEANPVSLTWEMRQARRAAQGFENVGNWENSVSANYEFSLMQWLTHVDGKKCIVELANDRTLVVRATILKGRTGKPYKEWPLILRNMFPMSHDWDGVSLWDITEYVQRHRSVLLNVAMDSAKLGAYPMWLYDTNKISKNADKNAQFNKWIGVNGPTQGAATPLPHNPVDATVQYVMDMLRTSAELASGAPDQSLQATMMRGNTKKGKGKTATQTNQESSAIEARYGLTTRIWGWSEAEFVKWWYRTYENFMPAGLIEKMVRIEGVMGAPIFRHYGRKDMITNHPMGPRVTIESKILSEAKKLRQYQTIGDYVKNFVLPDPNADSLYSRRRLGRLVMSTQEVEHMIPLTTQEEIAQSENLKIMDGETVPVDFVKDNHEIHLRVHSSLEDSPEARVHVIGHHLAIVTKQTQPELLPQGQPQGGPGDQQQKGGEGQLGSKDGASMKLPSKSGGKAPAPQVGKAPEGMAGGQAPHMQ